MEIYNRNGDLVMKYDPEMQQMYDLNGNFVSTGSLVGIHDIAGAKLGVPYISDYVDYCDPEVIVLTGQGAPIAVGAILDITVLA